MICLELHCFSTLTCRMLSISTFLPGFATYVTLAIVNNFFRLIEVSKLIFNFD